MRTPFAVALLALLLACGSSDRRADSSAQSAASSTPRGSDPVVLRVPREGGPVRAYLYPRLDTAVWTSEASAPSPARTIGFDPDAGSLVYVDAKGTPRRIDLRVGAVTAAAGPKAQLEGLVTSDGSAIFGVSSAGGVVRLIPSGETWTFNPATGARGAFH